MATLGFYLGVTVHSPAAEKLLREILAQNPDRNAQGNACYGLGRFYYKKYLDDFWGSWCGPCRAMVPKENEMVKRMQGRPFAFLGVCNDYDREKVKKWIGEQGINWRSWWDGGIDHLGPIAEAWHIASWPRLFIIDYQGVIRYAGDEGMTDRIMTLVEEVLKEIPAAK